MRSRWRPALVAVAGLVVLVAVVGGGVFQPGGAVSPALAQQNPQTAPGGPGPGAPGTGPSQVGPWGPGYGPGRGWDPGGGFWMYRGRHAVGPGFGVLGGFFALGVLLRIAFLIALLVLAWKAITSRTLWGRPDGAVQVVRERFARGEISEEEYRKRLAAL